MTSWESYWSGRAVYEMTTNHIPNIPFEYFSEPVVMKNDDRLVSAFVEDHPNFLLDEACRMLSMDAVRLIKAMKRVGLDLEWRNTEYD